MLNMDEDVLVKLDDVLIFEGAVRRNIGVIAKTLQERGDPASIFSGEIRLELARE